MQFGLMGKILFAAISSLLVMQVTYGKMIAVVSSVKGHAFYMANGQTKILKVGTHLPSQSEVFTELGAQVSFNDYYDHVFHLSGSGHMTLYKSLVELKSGYLWAQSLSYSDSVGPLRILTANAEVEFAMGEGIISFDGAQSKTQLLSVKGDFILRNTLEKYLETDVPEGKFSFIATDFDGGRPRKPTSVGYGSYQKITTLFSGVEPLNKREMSRNVASARPVATQPRRPASAFEMALQKKQGRPARKVAAPSGAGGTIQYVVTKSKDRVANERSRRGRLIASYYNRSLKPTVKKKKKSWKPSYQKKSGVSVQVFGAKSFKRAPASTKSLRLTVPVKVPAKKRSRIPASLIQAPTKPAVQGKKKSSVFETKLMHEYSKQMRHKKELNGLIDELKSVDKDYQKNY